MGLASNLQETLENYLLYDTLIIPKGRIKPTYQLFCEPIGFLSKKTASETNMYQAAVLPMPQWMECKKLYMIPDIDNDRKAQSLFVTNASMEMVIGCKMYGTAPLVMFAASGKLVDLAQMKDPFPCIDLAENILMSQYFKVDVHTSKYVTLPTNLRFVCCIKGTLHRGVQ